MKRIAFDLDGVIGTVVLDKSDPIVRYGKAEPILEMIKTMNDLYEKGNYIIVYTARGMSTYRGDASLAYDNLAELTKNQLQKWGVKYHQLVMGKIHYDVLVDDKAINSCDVSSSKTVEDFITNK